MLSLLNKRWKLFAEQEGLAAELADALRVSAHTARLLINRGIKTPEEGQFFIRADLAKLHDPFLITGMREAVDRVVRAIDRKENIRLFCDYDVDGVTSAAFLTHFFRDLGINVRYYLPERMAEGYGLNADAVKKIRDEGCTLMITADCGITAVSEVKWANELGLDVIITDHHQVGAEGLPEAVAVLNPHRPDCNYPYRFLSGVGIVFKLATAIRTALYEAGWEKARLPNLKRHLDLFALGTIADVAPLTGENHVLSAHGLAEMTTSAKPGIVALKEVSGVNGKVTSRTVGFGLGPRLNAAGRLGRADAGFHLLTSTDLKEALELARALDATNIERKEIQKETVEEAEYLMGREVDLGRDRVIVLASENFHPGVIGIAAARLVEKYFRPTVLIALNEGVGKGSARSIPAFNIHKAFTECAAHLTQFGGHAYAAGLSMDAERVEDFRRAMNAVGQRVLSVEDLIPELSVDAILDLGHVDRRLYKEIQLLEPFGAVNPTPVFLARGVKVQKLRLIGKEEQHVRFRAVQGKAGLDAVAFNMAEPFSTIDAEPIDIVYELQINDWNGQDKLELKILDVKVADPSG